MVEGKYSEAEAKARKKLKESSIDDLLEEMLVDSSFANRQESAKRMLDYRINELQINILSKMNKSTNILLIFAVLSFLTALITLFISSSGVWESIFQAIKRTVIIK